MKLFVHFCSSGFCNCYILGSDDSSAIKEAIIIDPGSMDTQIINIIEENEYALRGIFCTHGHRNHVHGITTLKRIYDIDIYCISPEMQKHKTTPLRDREILNIGSFVVEVIAVPGHSADSAVFKIDHMLFTGDALTAGLVGSTASVYGAANQMTALRNKIFSLPGHHTIFPGHGPPTSLEAERRFNSGVNAYKDYVSRRPSFKLELE